MLSLYSMVIDTLRVTDPEKKAFRMVGSTLVQGTVGSILPSVEMYKEQVCVIVVFLFIIRLII